PEHAPEETPAQCGRGSLAQHGDKAGGKQTAEYPWREDPTEDPADQPVGFPGPAFHAAKRDIKTAGGQAAEPVKDHTEERVGIHDSKRVLYVEPATSGDTLDVSRFGNAPRRSKNSPVPPTESGALPAHW